MKLRREWHSGMSLIDSARLRSTVGIMLISLLPAACSEPPTNQVESRFPEVEVVIPGGATAIQIGRELRTAGLVQYPRIFALTARVIGSESSLKAGRYRFALDASYFEMLEALERGT
ncbi:MAG: endolytic transglycosylase MltG, partial [Gemmatimonadetes bacterium]|nr:endolytic transglycosylase MltG [Gemmatimonadota bacterium]